MAMQLTQSMRPEMRQLLTPRMIQSMEILQLPLMALEERIEQELQNNPVLELDANDAEDAGKTQITDEPPEHEEDRSESEQPLVVKEDDPNAAADFDRLEKLSDYLENEEFFTNAPSNYRVASSDGERDKKMDAMTNTAAHGEALSESLLRQWAFVECKPEVHAAGACSSTTSTPKAIFAPTWRRSRRRPGTPSGSRISTKPSSSFRRWSRPASAHAALQECLLLQLDALEEDEEMSEGHDFDLERRWCRTISRIWR